MRISVVVPLYNKAIYVMRALASIAGQGLGDFEAIIVDDGSTDGGGELAAGFADRRFRVVRQANAGPGAARNRGIEEAQGELVAFLDADDAWLPEYLESSVGMLDAHGPEVVAATSGYIESPAGVSLEPMWRKRGLRDGVQQVTPQMSSRMLGYMVAYMTSPATVARRAALRRWGGFYWRNGCRYGEDAALWLKVLLNDRVCFQLRPLVTVDRAASQLGGNFSGPRPVEPFLTDPEDVERVCPPALLPLLGAFYARCASKTAVVLGCWGESARARALVRRYARPGNVELPLFLMALAACTPGAGLLGRAFRPLIAAGQSRREFLRSRLS